MDFGYLRKNAALNLFNLTNLVKAPSQPKDVRIDNKRMSNTSCFTWTAPNSGKVKGYYVLMRETTSPVWQKKFFTTSNELTLPYSKDNYFFAVQAVSESGNQSLPVLPVVLR